MCGRYYVDEETAKEIRRLVLKLDAGTFYGAAGGTAAVFPSQKAAVIMGRERHLEAEQMLWGFPRFEGKGLSRGLTAEGS